MEITWHGNASLELTSGGSTLVLDPFLGRPFEDQRRLAPETFVRAGAFLLTHGHFDHAGDMPQILARHPVPVFAPQEVCRNLVHQLAPSQRSLLRGLEPLEHFTWGQFEVTALPSRHVSFDLRLILNRLGEFFTGDTRRKSMRLVRLLREHRKYPEGRCFAYLLEAGGRRTLCLGSLGWDPSLPSPHNIDLMCLPCQGTSYLVEKAVPILTSIVPHAVLFHHHDDAFPPLSYPVPLKGLVEALNGSLPSLDCITPVKGQGLSLP